MEFYIDFNRTTNDYVLRTIGAVEKFTDDDELLGYFVKINSLEELGLLESKIHKLTSIWYSLIISVNDKTIYIDKDI